MTILDDMVVRLLGDASGYLKSLQQASAATANFEQKVLSAGKALSIGLALPLASLEIATAKMAATYQRELIKVETLTNNTREQVYAWNKDLMRLAPTVGIAPTEL